MVDLGYGMHVQQLRTVLEALRIHVAVATSSTSLLHPCIPGWRDGGVVDVVDIATGSNVIVFHYGPLRWNASPFPEDHWNGNPTFVSYALARSTGECVSTITLKRSSEVIGYPVQLRWFASPTSSATTTHRTSRCTKGSWLQPWIVAVHLQPIQTSSTETISCRTSTAFALANVMATLVTSEW